MKRPRFPFLLILIFLFSSVLYPLVAGASLHMPDAAHAATAPQESNDHDEHAAGHGDPFAQVFEVLAIILICAVIGRFAARKLKQSPVLGEIIIGIIVVVLLPTLVTPPMLTWALGRKEMAA